MPAEPVVDQAVVLAVDIEFGPLAQAHEMRRIGTGDRVRQLEDIARIRADREIGVVAGD